MVTRAATAQRARDAKRADSGRIFEVCAKWRKSDPARRARDLARRSRTPADSRRNAALGRRSR